uniref:Uncharacterized protein n=1 Tax=Oryza brachyantha TaxID=4533 RepID=J3LTP6_ORYBR
MLAASLVPLDSSYPSQYLHKINYPELTNQGEKWWKKPWNQHVTSQRKPEQWTRNKATYTPISRAQELHELGLICWKGYQETREANHGLAKLASQQGRTLKNRCARNTSREKKVVATITMQATTTPAAATTASTEERRRQ